MKRTIYFDMDGTLAALFFIKGFAARLDNGDCTVYTECKTLYKPAEMSAVITALKAKGYDIGIISYVDEKEHGERKSRKNGLVERKFPLCK